MGNWQISLLVFGAALLPSLALSIWFLQKNKRKLELFNTELQAGNQQREALIRELHHRVKNNLQEISSMLYLQIADLEDERLRDALEDARGRIDALGLIYRLLYQQKKGRFTDIPIADYVRELVQYLERANHLMGKDIEQHLDLQEISIEMDQAMHIGLVLNELIQNCFKHAFPHTQNPALYVTLKVEDNNLLLSVRDNGPGWDGATAPNGSGSFGLKLVRLIVEGREGTFKVNADDGAGFWVTMPLHG
jgi:two-component sensor histidine kinase